MEARKRGPPKKLLIRGGDLGCSPNLLLYPFLFTINGILLN